MKKNEQKLRDLCCTIKCTNMYIMEIPERERKERKEHPEHPALAQSESRSVTANVTATS